MKNYFRILILFLVVGSLCLGCQNQNNPVDVVTEVNSFQQSDQQIKEAFDQTKSDFWIQSQGKVLKVLKDDVEGSRHQRFIVELSNGHSILIAHNIDIAPRVDNLQSGDMVGFYGEYEWNNKGGVIHWTHHDPQGKRPSGWLEYNQKKYQ